MQQYTEDLLWASYYIIYKQNAIILLLFQFWAAY